MRVGLDCDGVMYPFLETYRTWRRLVYGLDIPECRGWAVEGVSQEEFNRECQEAADAGFLFVHGDPLPGALDAVAAIRERGHTIHIVTARTPEQFGPRVYENTYAWLEFWDLRYESIDFTHDKASVPTDIFLDDNVGNVDRLLAAGIDAWLLYDPPREDQLDHPRFIRTWSDFIDRIDALEALQKEKAA